MSANTIYFFYNMDARTQQILQTVIEEYIKQAEPISSGFLYEHLQLGLSPATLRNELFSLEELGFLEKPHTSAGRIPTPRGYRFFVDNLLQETPLTQQDKKELSEMQNLNQLHEFLARKAGSVVIGGGDIEHIDEVGLTDLLEAPEFLEHEVLLDFIRRAEYIRKEFASLLSLIDQEPHFYIGEEAKDIIGESRYSVLLTRVGKDNGAICFGLTRMNYANALSLARYVSTWESNT